MSSLPRSPDAPDATSTDAERTAGATATREPPPPLPSWFRRGVLYVGFVVLGFLVGAWMFTRLRGFWPTLMFGFFIGLALTPIVNRLSERGWRRGVAAGVALAALVLGGIAFFAVFGNLLFSQLASLVTSVPGLLADALEWVNRQFNTELSTTQILDQIGLGPDDLASVAAELGLGAVGIIAGTVSALFSLLMMLFFGYYFAADGPRLRRTLAFWMPPARQRMFSEIWDIAVEMAGQYVISRGILAAFSAVAHAVLFAILGLPYWLPLALWVGLVSQFVPTVGTYLAGALPIAVALVTGDVAAAIVILAFIVLYQQVENLFLTPRITQSTLEIHAAVAFGAVIIGGTLYGATGALLSIPVVATVLAVIKVYGRRYELVPELAAEHEREQAAGGGRESRRPSTVGDPLAADPSAGEPLSPSATAATTADR
jgi:predicted PurR-regulated permease PerM